MEEYASQVGWRPEFVFCLKGCYASVVHGAKEEVDAEDLSPGYFQANSGQGRDRIQAEGKRRCPEY